MNIKAALLKDKAYSKQSMLEISEYACMSAKNFKELIQCFLANEYRLAQRAAWCVNKAASHNHAMIKPYLKILVDQLSRTDVHAAVIRNSIRILEQAEIPKPLHGKVMNICFEFVEQPATAPAIKAFALTTLFNLSKYYPEIKPELKLIIDDRIENETPAFKSRGKKILKQLS